jgi:protein-S-isoprenylcysteine O-methyltransferase Ste14
VKYVRALLVFFIPVVPLLGLPLLGWGIDDLRGFLALYPRLGYVVSVAALGLAEAYHVSAAPEGSKPREGEPSKRVRRQRIVLVVIVLVLFGTFFFLPFADRRGIGVMMASQLVRWLGLGLCGLGFALMFWSRATLGRLYSGEVTLKKGHRLITAGVYRYIRHPVYLGIICSALGVAFLFRSWIGLTAMFPIVGGLLFRIKDEEALLHNAFGREWDAYHKRSWRLIPYLY